MPALRDCCVCCTCQTNQLAIKLSIEEKAHAETRRLVSTLKEQVATEQAQGQSIQTASDEKDKLVASLITEKHTWQALHMSKSDVDLGKFSSFMAAINTPPTAPPTQQK